MRAGGTLNAEMTGCFSKVARLTLQCAGRSGRLHNQFGVLLHHTIEMCYRVVNLMNSFHLLAGRLEDELTLLWKREMITGCYMPSWCKLELDDGRTVNALVFIMDPRHPLYEADTRTQVIAPLIAAASGPLGTNAQYLFSLDQELTRLGMKDDCLNELVMKVKALLEGNLLNNPLRPGFA